MDHLKILKRAFEITWNYRVLWVFGILLALTTGGGGGSGGGGGNGGGNGDYPFPPGTFHLPDISQQVISTMIAAAVGLVCVIFLLVIIGTIVRYVSETALYRMVNEHEDTGEKLSVRQGFRLGWSRQALYIFLIDLIVGLGSFVIFILLMLIAAAPLLLWLTDSSALGALGTVITVGLALLLIFAFVIFAIALSLLMQFVRRACVLENLGITDAFRRGYTLVRQRVGDILVMGILMFGLGLAWIILMIPVFITLTLAGVVVAGLPALLVGAIASLFTEGFVPWIIATVVGLPLFILVLAVPGTFLGGLVEVFKSSTWTLTYRELLALESLQPASEPDQPEPVAELPEPA